MSYADFEATGTSVPFACSICGRRRLFPDQLVYSDDKLFRCTDACDERTAYNVDQQRAAWRAPPEPVPSIGGPLPQGDVVTTFLQDAADFRSQVIPGWTPSTQFYDDFTVIPGGVGSSWTVATSGAGTVTQPSANVARFDSPGTGSAAAYVSSVSVPDPSAGRFFCACLAKVSIATGVGVARTGTATNAGAASAMMGRFSTAAGAYYSLSSSSVSRTTVELDTSKYVTFRVWWKTGGSVFGSVDDSPFVFVRTAFSAARLPYISVQNAAARLDVTNYVAFT
jgi:hypothetical protein